MTAPPLPCSLPYGLRGPHVEPEASYWMYCARLRLVSIDELRAVTDDPKNACADAEDDPNTIIDAKRCYFPPHPDPADRKDCQTIEEEFQELVELARRGNEPVKPATRDDPCLVAGPDVPGPLKFRRPISRLWNLQPQTLGAVVAYRSPGEQVIRTGRGLARAVESETPGLYHRHVLNFLMLRRPAWSPPRQALVWAALDVAIASALQAAWYYKWLSGRPRTARRERPIEYAIRTGRQAELPVLFDGPDELNPTFTFCPTTNPGTPRHPAYPSGHSTYAGAASAILRFFFGNDPTPPALRATPASPFDLGAPRIGPELDNLADNIGLGRMWGGIHWRSDHTAGLRLGRTVARLVLEQLFETGTLELCRPQRIPPNQCSGIRPPCSEPAAPSIADLEKQKDVFKSPDHCGKPVEQKPCRGPIPFFPVIPLTPEQITEVLERLRRALEARPEERDALLQEFGRLASTLAEEDQALLDAGRSPQEGAAPQPDAGQTGRPPNSSTQ